MTPTHSLDSLLTFIQNASHIADLEAQIESKEQDVQGISDLISFYEETGFVYMLPGLAERCNKETEELILLKLAKNEVEKRILEFELNALRAD